jgi:hypothetical protein
MKRQNIIGLKCDASSGMSLGPDKDSKPNFECYLELLTICYIKKDNKKRDLNFFLSFLDLYNKMHRIKWTHENQFAL